jgi:PKD repeat protein
VLFDIAQAADASGITTFGFSLPADLSLVGMAASQGLILGVPDQTFCNALDLRIGFAPPLPAPAADFSASATLGVAPLAVTFSDLSTGTVSSWNWDFGDSATSTLQNPSHTYNAVGTYPVGLRVTGPGGLDIERKFDYIQAQ